MQICIIKKNRDRLYPSELDLELEEEGTVLFPTSVLRDGSSRRWGLAWSTVFIK